MLQHASNVSKAARISTAIVLGGACPWNCHASCPILFAHRKSTAMAIYFACENSSYAACLSPRDYDHPKVVYWTGTDVLFLSPSSFIALLHRRQNVEHHMVFSKLPKETVCQERTTSPSAQEPQYQMFKRSALFFSFFLSALALLGGKQAHKNEKVRRNKTSEKARGLFLATTSREQAHSGFQGGSCRWAVFWNTASHSLPLSLVPSRKEKV